MGLDHHVTHLRLRRHFPRRDRVKIPRIRRCILLVLYALATENRSAHVVHCRLAGSGGKYHRDLGCKLCVSDSVGHAYESTTQLILSSVICA